jgi:hypothetical protein
LFFFKPVSYKFFTDGEKRSEERDGQRAAGRDEAGDERSVRTTDEREVTEEERDDGKE